MISIKRASGAGLTAGGSYNHRSHQRRGSPMGKARKRAAASAISGFVLLLAGCASMAPTYQPPALPVAGQYAPETPLEPIGNNAAATGWSDYFTDPSLQALIEQALANNRDLRSALLRVNEARAAFGIQRADAFPTLSAQAGATRSRTPADLNASGQPQLSSQYQVALGVASWEIDFWGRVRSLQDAALQTFLATDEAREATTVALVAQVASSYFALHELDERIALAQQTTMASSPGLAGRQQA